MKDLKLISGELFEYELPKEHRYLYKYYSTAVERSFVNYYFCFNGDFENFVDHTGVYAAKKWIGVMKRRLIVIMESHKKAKEEMDMKTLAFIEAGKMSLCAIET